MKWIGLIIILGLSTHLHAQKSTTIYLIRHAEKQVSEDHPRDPELTKCGIERAKSIANYLSHVNIDAVYSTDYHRTIQTAEPTALLKDTDIEIYDPNELDAFAQKLLSEQKNALVVGHSNTTAVLAEILTGKNDTSLSMSEEEYNRIYQILITSDTTTLNHFKSTFVCIE